VFWIHASNIDRIEQSYREIAERAKIPGREDPKANILYLVAGWLQDESKGTWLLVLDNLDDGAVLSTPQAATLRPQSSDSRGQLRRPLSAYLPQIQNGTILITTRTRNVAIQLVERRDIIQIDPMTNIDAKILLQRKLDESTNEQDLEELASILEYMPLAIVQAAAYIQQKGSRYRVQRYIEAFQKNERLQTSLLNYEAGPLRRDLDAKNSIMITWQISFNDIREKWPASADILSLMSYFDRQGIPEDVLKVQLREEVIQGSTKQEDGAADDEKDKGENIDDDCASEANDDDFEEAVLRLRSYSFVSLGEDGRTFEMHRLVQLAMREWLKMHGEEERWKTQFIRKLNAVFPTGDHKHWGMCEKLFPHAKSAERQRPIEDRSVLQWAQLLRKAGWYAWSKGGYVEAQRMCELSAGVLRKLLGEDDTETTYSRGLLALVYMNQGRWTEAEIIQVQVIETQKKVLGEEHPLTLNSMANLASTYMNQGRWTEAEMMQVQVMETSQRVLGEEHPSTLSSMASLASTYWNQGRWTEAETIQVQVIEIQKRVLGEEHPSTLSSMANLATIYRNQGRWTEAETIQVQVIEIQKRVLGEEHPLTLISLANLATTYMNQGRRTEAETMQVQVIETRKRVLGEEHPDTLSSMANLASTYWNQGRWTEAETIQVQVIETQKRVLGEEHPSTLSSMANLATIYWNQGRWTEAETMNVQVIETRKRVLGEEHPDTLNSMANIAFTMKEQGKEEDAVRLLTEYFQLCQRILGPRHPNTLSSAAALTRWSDMD
jgi:tetratricopeptide (TPR) repeat protein